MMVMMMLPPTSANRATRHIIGPSIFLLCEDEDDHIDDVDDEDAEKDDVDDAVLPTLKAL